jgi:glutaconate CoA-transferase subunit A
LAEDIVRPLDALIAEIGDGALLAVPPDYSGVAMAATRALIRRGVRKLRLLAVPQSGLQTDLLVGAGCVAAVESAAISLGELGPAPRFTAAVLERRITMTDSTCPAIHAALQATEKGVPFFPLRGLIGSDVLRFRPDWRVIDNPFASGDPIVLLPAIAPELALFHAPLADRAGNVWIGRRRELVSMAHAADKTLVTVEEIVDGNLMDDQTMAAGVLPALYVAGVAHAPKGAWPLGLAGRYPPDTTHLARYAELAKSAEGFARYLAEHAGAAQAAE